MEKKKKKKDGFWIINHYFMVFVVMLSPVVFGTEKGLGAKSSKRCKYLCVV